MDSQEAWLGHISRQVPGPLRDLRKTLAAKLGPQWLSCPLQQQVDALRGYAWLPVPADCPVGQLRVAAGEGSNLFGVHDGADATTAATSLAAVPGEPVALPPGYEQVWCRRPLNTALFERLLVDDVDQDFLLGVLHHGVQLVGPAVHVQPYSGQNYSSALSEHDRVSEVVAEDLAHGRLLPIGPESAHYVHPLGAVPKPPNGIRVIHDHSYPVGSSLNDHQRHWRLAWDSLDYASQYMVPHVYMAKFDLSAYYRHFPVFPPHWQYQCFTWDGQSYLDGFLEFGVRIAPEVAHRFTCCLKRLLWANGIRAVSAIVDDFLLMHTSEVYCRVALVAALALMMDSGFEVNLLPHKTSLPCLCLKYVGVILDSRQMVLRLPEEKLQKLLAGCAAALLPDRISIAELHSLIGLLQWASKVVLGGRCFMHGLWSFLSEIQASAPRKSKVRLPSWARADLQWWLQHSVAHNGLLRLHSPQLPIINYQLPNGPVKAGRRWGQRHPQGANLGSNGIHNFMSKLKQWLPPAHPKSLASQCMSGQPISTCHALTS